MSSAKAPARQMTPAETRRFRELHTERGGGFGNIMSSIRDSVGYTEADEKTAVVRKKKLARYGKLKAKTPHGRIRPKPNTILSTVETLG